MMDGIFRALTYPLSTGEETLPPGRILLVNVPFTGNAGSSFPKERTICWNWLKNESGEWEAKGYGVSPQLPQGDFDAVFLAAPQQRDSALGLIAQCVAFLKEEGLLVVAAPNDAGGRRLPEDLAPFCSALHVAGKQKCRIVWARKQNLTALPDVWVERAAPRIHPQTGTWTQPGLFSWDRVDAATTLLLPFVPQEQKGVFVDAGSGNGVITCHILRSNPEAAIVHACDVDFRAVAMCRRNVSATATSVPCEFIWGDFIKLDIPVRADWVIMNPPFHQGKKEAVALGQQFIITAANILKPGGTLLVVANAHLPYEKILHAHFSQVEKCHEKQGFKIFRARL